MFKQIRTNLLGSLLVLLGVAAVPFYFYQKNRPASEPMRTYRATTPSLKAAHPPTETTSPAEIQTHAGHTHAGQEHTERLTMREKRSALAHSQVETPASSNEEAVTEAPTVLEGMSEEEATAWVNEQFEMLSTQLAEKYPELARYPYLTTDEANALYATDEAKDALLEMALQARAEFFADFRQLFSLLPKEVVEATLDETRKLFTKNWGAEAANSIIAEIREEMGL